jgi:hypothetical protein
MSWMPRSDYFFYRDSLRLLLAECGQGRRLAISKRLGPAGPEGVAMQLAQDDEGSVVVEPLGFFRAEMLESIPLSFQLSA